MILEILVTIEGRGRSHFTREWWDNKKRRAGESRDSKHSLEKSENGVAV